MQTLVDQTTLLNTADVASLAGVHRDTLLRWLREKRVLEPRRDRNGWRVFTQEEASAISQYARRTEKATSASFPSPERTWERLDSIDWNFVDAKTSYLTHGLHPYPAKFIPQIPNALIQELSSVGETVADIFCGSGTTLVEALTLKRNAVGLDANPLACLISRVKTSRIQAAEAERLRAIAVRAEGTATALSRATEDGQLFKTSTFTSKAPRPADKAVTFWFDSFIVEELAEILSWCNSLPTETSRAVARNAFSSIVVNVSKQDSDTRYTRRIKHLKPGDAFRRFSQVLSDGLRALEEFSEIAEPRFTCQVLHANLLEEPSVCPFDLVVCSPPYPNAFSYHLYHMTRMLWLGMDQASFKRIEIGSHRKYSNRGPGRATVHTFAAEMRKILIWLGRHLRQKRYACFVIGNSILNGERVDNVALVSALGTETGMPEVKRLRRTLQETRKAFNPAYAKIKTEHILILQNQSR